MSEPVTGNKEYTFFLPNFCSVTSVFILSIGAQLIAFMLILATGDKLSESWDELGLLSIFVQWIALTSAGVLCLSKRWLSKLPLFWSAVVAYFMIVLTTTIISATAQYFLISIDYQWGSVPETIGQFVFRCSAISAILSLVALRYFYVQQQWKQRIELESQARVEALQARIRPHFLFNSMNIIASLIRTDADLAEQAVEDLSELFRASLKQSGSMVPLSEEWILCRNYLRIEGLRLGNRLTLDVDLQHVPQDAAIPMLTLQPLVENAIYHGIQPLPQGGAITVLGTMSGNMVCITIVNPVPKQEGGIKTHGNQIAMANIRHRLNLLFGSHAKLIVNKTDELYEVKVLFPYIKGGV
ncbi:MAG: sensor histidine kinase [Candidatus Berkiella sp.]